MTAYRNQGEMRAKHRREGLCRCGRPREDKRFVSCLKCRRGRQERWIRERETMTLHSEHCECGRGRKRSIRGLARELHACVLCYAQDGIGPRQFDAIQVLRAAEGPLTTEAIAFELSVTANTATVMLARLVDSGLVGKRALEPYGGAIEFARGMQTEYYLRGARR